MKQKFTPQQLLDRARAEWQAYQGNDAGGKFRLSNDVTDQMARLTRDLEERRQLGQLTENELNILHQLDAFQQQVSSDEGQPAGNQFLNPEEDEEADLLAAPSAYVTEYQADKIIEGFEQQFKDKVLNRVKHPRKVKNLTHVSRPSGASAGRGLQEYMMALRHERLADAFSDPDSSVDLAKFKQKN